MLCLRNPRHSVYDLFVRFDFGGSIRVLHTKMCPPPSCVGKRATKPAQVRPIPEETLRMPDRRAVVFISLVLVVAMQCNGLSRREQGRQEGFCRKWTAKRLLSNIVFKELFRHHAYPSLRFCSSCLCGLKANQAHKAVAFSAEGSSTRKVREQSF